MTELRIALIVIAILIIVALIIFGLRRRKPQYDARPYDNQQDFSQQSNHLADAGVDSAVSSEVSSNARIAPTISSVDSASMDVDDPLFAPRKSRATRQERPTSQLDTDRAPHNNAESEHTAENEPDTVVPLSEPFANQSSKPSTAETDASLTSRSDTFAESPYPEPQNAAQQMPALLAYEGEPMIVQLQVMAKPGKVFNGDDLAAAFADNHLVYGKKKIYHYLDTNGDSLFSVANRLNPGYFSPDAFSDFHTDGLVLFALLPCQQPGTAVFDAMVDIAKQLAETLGGHVFDATNSSVSMQSIRFTRDEIAEFERSICLAADASMK